MAAIESRPMTDSTIWEAFLERHPEANFLHSWHWGVFHEKLGHTVIRLGFYEGDVLRGVLLGVVEPARRGPHVVVPGGPILEWDNAAVVRAWVEILKREARRHGCWFVRVRPQLVNTPENRQRFRSLGFRKAPMHLHAELTSQLDLAQSDNELRKAMRKGTRYELRQAEKQGVRVEATTTDDFIEEFYDLQIETARRQGFVPFSKEFLREQFQVFAADDNVLMYRASYDGNLLAMAFIIFYGQEAAYHYGASTELARKIPGAYALQWAAIQEARRRGCSRYNFWGVAEHGQKNHRFYGVSVFKRGFGGEDVAYVPAQDLVVRPLRYVFTYIFETYRRKARRL